MATHSAIRERGSTVILVTHFMDEAEHLCDRIAVIDNKHVVALDTPRGLIETYVAGSTVSFSTNLDDLAFLQGVEGVELVKRHGCRVSVRGRGAVLAHVANALVQHGEAPIDLEVKRRTLEDAFLEITGGAD